MNQRIIIISIIVIITILLLVGFIWILVDKNSCGTCCKDNFKNSKMILHHHVTHSAGTKLLDIVKKNKLKADWINIEPNLTPQEVEKYLLNLGLDWVQIEGPLPKNIPWDSPYITYTTILREPLSRALAGDGFMKDYPEIEKDSDYSRWIEEKPQLVDNYLTRWIINKWCGYGGCGDGVLPKLTEEDLEEAQGIIKKFDIVMFLDEFPEGAEVLKNKLGWEHWDMGHKRVRKSIRDKLNGDEKLMSKLMDKNKHDTRLYKFAKTANKQKTI